MKYLSLAAGILLSSASFADNIAIVNAKAVTLGQLGTLEQATILIKDGVIERVSAQAIAPKGYTIVDAKGQYVTPGFVGTTVNWGTVEVDAESSSVDSYSELAGPSMRIANAVNADSTRLPTASRWGFSRAIIAPGQGDHIFAGQGAEIKTIGFDAIQQSSVGQFVNVESAHLAEGSRGVLWVALERALVDAKHYAKNPRDRYANASGYSLSLDSLEALQSVINGQEPLIFDANRAGDLLKVIEFSQQHNLKAIIRGGAEAWRVADQLAQANIGVVINPVANLPGDFNLIGARLENAALLEKAGVKMAFSMSDTYTGQNLTQVAGNAVANGLSWNAAIRALTTYPAAMFDLEYSATLTDGAHADVVIWSGDPLELNSAPTYALINGMPIELATRGEKLANRYLMRKPGEAASYVKTK